MAEPTTYVVLHRLKRPSTKTLTTDSVSSAVTAEYAGLPDELWQPVGERDATRREDAIASYVEDTGELVEGFHEFRAVAKSSWPDETFPYTITTKRVVERVRTTQAASVANA